MQTKHCFRIECRHSPEMVDRIMAPIRKRGLQVASIHYIQKAEETAVCIIELEEDPIELTRIIRNMLRSADIHSVIEL
jgi:acetolactate synthase regulatory subunit